VWMLRYKSRRTFKSPWVWHALTSNAQLT
jgi:hypothetical protein